MLLLCLSILFSWDWLSVTHVSKNVSCSVYFNSEHKNTNHKKDCSMFRINGENDITLCV